jgi:hypothetical protein
MLSRLVELDGCLRELAVLLLPLMEWVIANSAAVGTPAVGDRAAV